MTWAEFRIRKHAYLRQDLNDWRKVREIAYYSLIGAHYDPKKLPKTKEAFLPLDGSRKSKVTQLMKSRIEQAKKQYLIDVKNGKSKIKN